MKKILATVFILIFLISAVSFVSAEDSESNGASTIDIPVKIIWDNSGSGTPSSVTVELIKDGSVVDSATLSESNSWKGTFKNMDSDGHYSITVSSISGFKTTTSGNAQEGFLIKNTAVQDTLTKIADDDVSDDNSNDVVKETESDFNATGSEDDDNTENTTTNETDDNKTTNETEDNETTNQTVVTTNTNKTTTNTDVNKAPIKQVIKKQAPEKKPPKKNNVTKNKLKHTGLPVIALVLVAGIAAIIPFRKIRK